MTTLGGALFVADGTKYDYCFREAVESLKALCDQVSVICFNDEDCEKLRDVSCRMIQIPYSDWENSGDRVRLSYWMNRAKGLLDTDWYFALQADEIIHESSFGAIRQAITSGEQGFVVRRFNLWGDPQHYLAAASPPCSEYVTRLARIGYDSEGDGESVSAPASDAFKDAIRIYHMGFVRDRKVHISKMNNMGDNIFHWGRDPRTEGMVEFDPWKFFDRSEVRPIEEPLPIFIQEWAEKRTPTEV